MRRPIPERRLEDLLSTDRGLTAGEVEERRLRFGANDIIEAPPSGWRDVLRETIRDPMIWFLLIASGLFAAVGNSNEAAVLLAAIVPLIGMDAYLHRRTQASTRGLAGRLAAQARVVRDETVREIAAREIVPGDLAVVRTGEPFPADGLLVTGEGLQVDESTLTGEAFPVRKHPLAVSNDLPSPDSADAAHWGFAGTRLLTGEARLRIACTGPETLYGEIVQSALQGRRERTPLQEAIGRLVTILLGAAIALCTLLAAIRLWQGYGVIDAFLSAATLAVAALPEELPVAFTFFLGVGIFRLARRQALVRRAVVVENIGRVSAICTDKTGTLTEGRLALAHSLPVPGGSEEHLLAVAAAASRRESGDPVDLAILAASRRALGGEAPIATFPFTEARRRETTIIRGESGLLLAVVKGAPEAVFALSRIDAASRGKWESQVEELAKSGYKVIACAERELNQVEWAGGEPNDGYAFQGLLAFGDLVREGVREAVGAARAAGIRVLMITGDHPVTAAAVAREVGLIDGQTVVLDLERSETTCLRKALQSVDVVARAMPSQKLDLVQALQSAGEIVAVTGDGVNDVPALRRADIGIAMGERGTRSAREVASIVLLDDNFRTIVRAIVEGRQLFQNFRLSLAYLLMVHIPLVLTAALVPMAGFPLLYLPIHIVWLELIIHPTALLVFQDYPPELRLQAADRRGQRSFFDAGAWFLICCVGLGVAAIVAIAFQRSLGAGWDVEHARAMALSALIIASAAITAGLSGLRTRAAVAVVGTAVVSAIVFVQSSSLASLLHLAPLHVDDWLIAAAGGVLAGGLSVLVRLRIRRDRH